MQLNDYYDRLDRSTRDLVATVYVSAIRQLKSADHPALSFDNSDATSSLLCWRIVSRFRLGVKNADELKAYAIAGIDTTMLLRCLKAVRTEFEAKQSRYEQLRACLAAPGRFNRKSIESVLSCALIDLVATRKKYTNLLLLWANEPWRLAASSAAPQRRIRLASSNNLCFD